MGRSATSPFERVIEPGLKRLIEKSRTHLAKPRAPRSSSASAAPTFGFLAAPKFVAYDVADQDQSSLSVFTSGDFNGDGKPDLATVQASGAVNALLNQGFGNFGTVVTTTTDATTNVGGAIQAIAADVDHDGSDDLVILDGVNNAVQVMLSNKDGTFAAPTTVILGDYQASSIAVSDLNADGYPDLVIVGSSVSFDANSQATTLIEMDTYLNDGHGGFLVPGKALKQIQSYSDYYQTLTGRSVVLTGVTQGGFVDATVEVVHFLNSDSPNEEHNIFTYLGKGTGAFQAPDPNNTIVIPAESTFNVGYPLVANLNVVDINGDGFKDVVFSYQDYNIWVSLGNGDGSYQFYSNVGAFQAYPTDMAVADINGDGVPEIIDAEPFHLGVYPNRGNGTFDTTSIPYYGSGLGQFSVLAIADFNGDGLADAALMNSLEGSVTIFAGVSGSKPAFLAGELINPARGYVSGVHAQAVLDANGDGLDDVLLFNSGPSQDSPVLLTGLGDGKGHFLYTDASPGFDGTSLDFTETASGDFNGDGHPDVVIHTFSSVELLLSNGDGTFRVSPVSLGADFNCQTTGAAIGDVNGDGKLDLLVSYEGDIIYGCNTGSIPSGFFTLLGKGDGTFEPATFTALGDELFGMVLADMNGDGKPDLVASDIVFDALNEGLPATFKTFQLLGKGDGTFQAAAILAPNYINALTLIGDINGDGKPDLVLLSEGLTDDPVTTLDLSAAGPLPLINNGDGTYVTGTQFAPGFFSAGGLLTDLDGDGKLDLLLSEFSSFDFTDSLTGGVAALGKGDGTFTAGSNFEVGASSTVILQGDFLKDSSPDAIFVSGGSGSTLAISQGAIPVTPAIAVSSAPSALTLKQGQTGSIAVTAQANTAFSGNVAFTVAGAPNGMSVLFSPANVTLAAGQAGTTTLVVSSVAPSGSASNTRAGGHPDWRLSGLLVLLAPFGRRKTWRALILPVAAVGLLLGAMTMNGCGSSVNQAPTGSTKLTITGTPSGGAATAQTVTVTVTVQ